MAKPRRKRRTSIRTAAGTVQKAYLERVRALRDDPLRVLPACPRGDPKPIARVRKRLEKMAAGRINFLDRRDKGVVGAVAHAIPLAEMAAVPRLVDQKVAGKRRFYLQRGQVAPLCGLGVQNHDDPMALVAAYREMATAEGLHFFAGKTLTCTGTKPDPPDDWWDAYQTATGLELVASEDGGRTCGHDRAARLELRFRGGPSLKVCRECAKGAPDLYSAVVDRYVGPDRRRPVEVAVRLADAEEDAPLPRERTAALRAGAVKPHELVQEGVQAWREAHADSGAFILGTRTFPDQEAFLEAVRDTGAQEWELDAIRVMTRAGHSGPDAAVNAILKAHRDRLAAGVKAVLGRDPTAFLARQGHAGPRDVLRHAHEEAATRRVLAALPDPGVKGPVGVWLDRTARHARTHPLRETLDRLREDAAMGAAPPHHVAAVVTALGGSALGVQGAGEDPPKEWKDLAAAVMGSEGEDYVAAVREYLRSTGTGEVAS